MIIGASFSGYDVYYANTIPGLAEKSGVANSKVVRDCNRNRPVASLLALVDAFRLVRDVKPDLIVSTGAAPGLLALFVGKLLGIQTIWIDSVANSEKLSMSGRLAARFVDLHLTQWQHLSNEGRPAYMGSVL